MPPKSRATKRVELTIITCPMADLLDRHRLLRIAAGRILVSELSGASLGARKGQRLSGDCACTRPFLDNSCATAQAVICVVVDRLTRIIRARGNDGPDARAVAPRSDAGYQETLGPSVHSPERRRLCPCSASFPVRHCGT